jgi:hypothetical protein
VGELITNLACGINLSLQLTQMLNAMRSKLSLADKRLVSLSMPLRERACLCTSAVGWHKWAFLKSIETGNIVQCTG